MQAETRLSSPFRISRALIIPILIFLVTPASAQQADADTYYKYGTQLISQQKYQDALKYIEYALAINPSIPGAWTQVGYCYEYLGQKSKAIEGYQKAVAANSEDVYAKSRLTALGGAPPVVPITDASELPMNTQEERDQITSLAVSSRTRKPKFKKFSIALQAGYIIRLSKEIQETVDYIADLFGQDLGDTSTRGIGFDLDLRYRLQPSFSLGLRIGSQNFPNPYILTQLNPFTGQSRIQGIESLTVTPVFLQGHYYVPVGSSDIYFGLGIGMYSAKLVEFSTDSDPFAFFTSSTSTVSGSGFGFSLQAGYQKNFSPSFGAFVDGSISGGKVGSLEGTTVSTGFFTPTTTVDSVWAKYTDPVSSKSYYSVSDKETVEANPDVWEKAGLGMGSVRIDVGLRLSF